jgi:hypothetical protein
MSLITSKSGTAVVAEITKAVVIDTFPYSLAEEPTSLYIGGEGDITVKLAGDILTDITFTVNGGTVFVGKVYEVVSATATGLRAIW